MNEIINVNVSDTSDTYYWDPSWQTWTQPSYSYYTYSATVYLYQVKCPKRACKKMNWMQLNMVTPCKGCGAKLRAIKEEDQADFDIPVG